MQTTLNKEGLKLMNNKQREIVLTQWQKHQHENLEVDYDVSGEGDVLKGFMIKKNVWNPFLASGRYHAHYLFYHNNLFFGKTAIEIGSGTGLMGVVMAKHGAKKVIMSDISLASVENSKDNAKKFGLDKICSVIQGDLFENIKEKADVITWMIPFFAGNPPSGDTISASMIMPPELFERFLKKAPEYLNKDGVIIIPSFSLGGDLTDPSLVAKNFNYDIKTTWLHKSINGIQQGMIYMHELRLKK
ncbi:methyltransferase [bacterium]|jgi:tRNA G37 N-methylase Trm5|nr:methyltransferase [bacterium]